MHSAHVENFVLLASTFWLAGKLFALQLYVTGLHKDHNLLSQMRTVTVCSDLPSNYTIRNQQQFHHHKNFREENKVYYSNVSSVGRWYKSAIIPDLEEENSAEGAAAYWSYYIIQISMECHSLKPGSLHAWQEN